MTKIEHKIAKEQDSESIHHFSKYIVALENVLDDIEHVLINQKEAVIASDVQLVEELTEKHYQLSANLSKVETEFIEELRKNSSQTDSDDTTISTLKYYYPEAEEIIDNWANSLKYKTENIKQKHQQVIHILEFAMLRNSNLMRTIYAMHSEKNTQYSINGSKSNMMNGIAVNQRA